jgi:hypothetical protein
MEYSAPTALTLRRGTDCVHWVGDWVDPTHRQGAVDDGRILLLPGTEPRLQSSPARSLDTLLPKLHRCFSKETLCTHKYPCVDYADCRLPVHHRKLLMTNDDGGK